MTASVMRAVIITVLAIGVLFVLVPRPYWSVVLIAIQAVALAGKAVIFLSQRRRP